MSKLFKDTYFGKPYKTRGEEKALYSHYDDNCNLHELFTSFGFVWVDDEGFVDEEHLCLDHPNDIVSEWPEKINEEELEEYAESASEGFWSDDMEMFDGNHLEKEIYYVCKRCYKAGIKAGYRKALE